MKLVKLTLSAFAILASIQVKAQLCYSTRTDYPGSDGPRNIVSADFDGNAKPDLAVVNYIATGLQAMTIYLNNGTGLFGAGTSYTMATGAHGIIAVDLNADGRIDLVTANKSSNNVSVRLGNGNGTFAAVTNYAVGVGPQSLTSVDVNNDSRLDLVVGNTTAGTVSVLLGSGTGTFGAPTNFVVGSGPNRVVSHDFNGDGAPDLAFTCGGNNAVRVLLNTGAGLFSPPVTYPVALGPSSIIAKDFNGDGIWDIAAGCMPAGGGIVSVLLGNGNGTFTTAVNYPVNGIQVWDLFASDINGDGRQDLITANNESANGISILYGNANGTFASPITIRNVTGTPLGITSADYNADGKMDIATANFTTTNSTVYLSGFELYNGLSDTTSICGTSTTLDAGSGYATYSWNTGATTQTINATTGGVYNVTVTNAAGCSASDNTFLSLVNAKIINNDTTICKGSSVTLFIDSLFTRGVTVCTSNQFPANLQNGLVGYWPFCADATDRSGRGHDGAVTGATLTTDRFGRSNNAYQFNGSSYIQVPHSPDFNFGMGSYTLVAWANCTGISQWEHILTKSVYSNAPYTLKQYYLRYDNNQAEITASTQAGANRAFVVLPARNVWKQFAGVFDAANNRMMLYIDGVLVSVRTNVYPITNLDNTWPLFFGVEHPTFVFPQFFTGKIDDVFMYNRVLSANEVRQLSEITPSVIWSNGSSDYSITVNPTQTTTYYVTVDNGITTCMDSVKVTVSDIGPFNPLQDTTSICGTSTILDAGSGYSTYSWNTGATTQSINATTGGVYKVTVTNAAGCSASDSTFLSLVNARIINNDTTICKGSSITLSIDSLFPGRTVCNANQLSASIRNGLLAYYPFCGNANDATGNGYNGVVSGALLEKDRFGVSASAYRFNGTSSVINATVSSLPQGDAPRTISLWVKTNGPFPANPNGYGSAIEYGTFQLSRRFGILISDFLNAYFVAQGNDANSAVFMGGDTWKLLTMTYSGGQIRFYLNGNFAGSGNVSPLFTFGFNLRMGNTINNGTNQNERYSGVLDDVMIWNRVLTDPEIRSLYTAPVSVLWSTGATSNTITVNPAQTTTYYVTVSDGITTCTDSVKVTVSDLTGYNSLQDTTRICGTSTVLDAGSGYSTYSWNTGATTQTINATTGGFYKVMVTNAAGCSASDSTLLSLVNARILNNDTTICKGSTVTLSIDSLFPGRTVCNGNALPASLRNGLVAYYPFCSNANDATGNGNNGSVSGAQLAPDRFGLTASAYNFNGLSNFITVPANIKFIQNPISYAFWFKKAGLGQNCGSGEVFQSVFSTGSYTTSRDVILPAGSSQTIGMQRSIPSGCQNELVVSASYTTGIWNHAVITYEANRVNVYLNGVFMGSTPVTCSVNTSNTISYIGSTNPAIWACPGYFNGSIDDLMIYDRVLSLSDVLNIYNRPSSVSWSTGATTNSITVNPTQTTTYYVTVSDGITTCTDSVKVTVSTVDTSLTILDPPQVCAVGGQVRFRAGVAATYQWQSGNNGVTFTNISGAVSQNYIALTTGYYRAIVTNALGCVDSTRIVQVVLNPQPVPSFTVNSNPQCLNTNNFTFTNTSSIDGGTMTYVWTFGDGGTATTTHSSHIYATAGTYTVKLVATSNNGCKDSTSQTVLVNPSPVAGFTVNNNSQCVNGNSFVFTNTSTISTGTLLYDWTFGDGGTATTNNATHTYGAAGTYTVKLVVRSTAGCADSITHIVTVYPKPIVSFTINTPVQCVNGNNYNFTNTSVINSGTMTYVWTFGDGGTASTTNATHVYTLSGTYIVKLVATSGNGCKDSTTQSVTVNPKPTVDFSVNNNAQCLQGNNFIFTNNSSISSGTLLSNWSFGDGGTATTFNATHVYGAPATYNVKLVVRSTAGCADSIIHPVTVYPMPAGAVTTPSAMNLCEGGSVVLNASGGASYQWLLGGQPIPGANGNSYTATQPGLYTVILISADGCQSLAVGSTTLTLISKPVASFSYDKYCAGFATQFTNTSMTTGSGLVTYAWDFGDGGNSTLVNPSHVFAVAGIYNVRLTVIPQACPALASVIARAVNITTAPANQRYPTVNAVASRDLQLTARSFTGAQYFWTPSAGLTNNFIANPVFNYDRQQQYLIRISTTEGCVITDTILVRIFKEREIYVPDVFSPNGDGRNDKLTPLLVGIATLKYFKVFDRWGQLMFSTNQAGAGWDGYYKGAKQPFETYAWIAEGVDVDGNTIKRSGSSILIR